MEKYSWIQFDDPAESETPLEVYLKMYPLLKEVNHYICAPITSPAGLDVDPSDVVGIKQANWDINLQSLDLLYGVGAIAAPVIFFPAAIGVRKYNGKKWGEFDHSIFNTMVSLRIEPSRASEFVSRVEFAIEEIEAMNNYGDQGEVRKKMYSLFEDKVVESSVDIPIDPLIFIVLHRYHLSFGCRYEVNLARRLSAQVFFMEGKEGQLSLVQRP